MLFQGGLSDEGEPNTMAFHLPIHAPSMKCASSVGAATPAAYQASCPAHHGWQVCFFQVPALQSQGFYWSVPLWLQAWEGAPAQQEPEFLPQHPADWQRKKAMQVPLV